MVTPEERGSDRSDVGPADDVSHHSFHGHLLISSKTNLPARHKVGRFSRLVDRWGWLGQLVGQGAIFVAGLAIGGGVMISRRGGPSRFSPELIIGLGVGCMLFAIVTQIVARDASRKWNASARG